MEQPGLLSDNQTKNKAADLPWKKSETDRMLDLYFGGTPPDRIAIKLNRNPKAVQRRLEQFTYNEEGRAERYQPYAERISRVKQRLTQNETLLIEAHAKRGVPKKATATVLQRSVAELGGPDKAAQEVLVLRKFFPVLDVIMALRYFYFKLGCKGQLKIVSDKEYDSLIHTECEFGGHGDDFLKIKSMGVNEYPFRIRGLANYLFEIRKEINSDTLHSL